MCKLNRLPVIPLLLAASLLFSACSRPTAQPTPTAEPATPVLPTQVETAAPTENPSRILLVDPAGAATVELTDYLAGIAAENGLALETITSPELPPQPAATRVVIFLAEPANLADIAAASPDTQFIVSGAVDLAGIPNLSIIRARMEDQVFMAGYLAMLISWDWRTAGLVPTDTVMAAEKANAFENGARYLCGQCTSYYAPLIFFPLLGLESAQAGMNGWEGQVAVLEQSLVNSFYVDPSIVSPELLDRLAIIENTVTRDIYTVSLAGAAAPERFTALVGADILPALEQILPAVLTGSGGVTVGAEVKIVQNNDESVVTPGKIDNFNRVASDLAAGIIVPLSVP